MLQRTCFLYVLVSLSSGCKARGPQWDIYDLLDSLGLKSFSGLLETTGYMYKLSEKASGPFTVYAPSEDAFSNLPPSVVKKLQNDGNWDLLHDLTSFHITQGNLSFFNWTNNKIIPTFLKGSSLRLNIYNNKSGEPSVMSACGATLIKSDQVATNGIVQVIDRVLYRYPGDSLANYIQQNSKLRTLAMLIQIAGGQDKINRQNITFFAPSDSAFNESGKDIRDIISNTTLIEEIIRNYTVSNTFYTNGLQILDGGFVTNNAGSKIGINVDEGNNVLYYLYIGIQVHGGCDRSVEDAYSSMAPDPAFAFVEGPCCPTLDFVYMFYVTMITFNTLFTSPFYIH